MSHFYHSSTLVCYRCSSVNSTWATMGYIHVRPPKLVIYGCIHIGNKIMLSPFYDALYSKRDTRDKSQGNFDDGAFVPVLHHHHILYLLIPYLLIMIYVWEWKTKGPYTKRLKDQKTINQHLQPIWIYRFNPFGMTLQPISYMQWGLRGL